VSAPEPRWANLRDAADYARRSPRTLRRWIHDGHLTASKVGGRLEIDLNAIDALRTEVPANGAATGDAATTTEQER
jgi:excisionase family DNA binding protein